MVSSHTSLPLDIYRPIATISPKRRKKKNAPSLAVQTMLIWSLNPCLLTTALSYTRTALYIILSHRLFISYLLTHSEFRPRRHLSVPNPSTCLAIIKSLTLQLQITGFFLAFIPFCIHSNVTFCIIYNVDLNLIHICSSFLFCLPCCLLKGCVVAFTMCVYLVWCKLSF